MGLWDLPQVLSIEKACFRRPWSAHSYRFELTENPAARYFVALRDGAVCGYGGMHLILEEGHITNLAVDPKLRGQGIGRQLLGEMIRVAANLGARYLTLEVRAGNAAAISLYRSAGFVPVSVRKGYYEEEGEDGLLMLLESLPPAEEGFTEPETVFE